MIKTLIPSFVKIGRLVQRLKHRTYKLTDSLWVTDRYVAAGYEKSYLLNPCVSLVAGCSLHHSPRIPLTPIAANDDLEGCFRRKTGTAGYKNMWMVRQEQTLSGRGSGLGVGTSASTANWADCPVSSPLTASDHTTYLVTARTFNNIFPICPHCPSGPSTRTSEHNRGQYTRGDTKHQQSWTDPRSLTARPQQITSERHKNWHSWNYDDSPGIWQDQKGTKGTKIHVWTVQTVNSYFSILVSHGAQRKQPASCPVAKDIAKHLFGERNQLYLIIWPKSYH